MWTSEAPVYPARAWAVESLTWADRPFTWDLNGQGCQGQGFFGHFACVFMGAIEWWGNWMKLSHALAGWTLMCWQTKEVHIYIYIYMDWASQRVPKSMSASTGFSLTGDWPWFTPQRPAWTDRNCNLEIQVVSRMNGRTPQGTTLTLPSFSLRLGLWTKSPTVEIPELTPKA